MICSATIIRRNDGESSGVWLVVKAMTLCVGNESWGAYVDRHELLFCDVKYWAIDFLKALSWTSSPESFEESARQRLRERSR